MQKLVSRAAAAPPDVVRQKRLGGKVGFTMHRAYDGQWRACRCVPSWLFSVVRDMCACRGVLRLSKFSPSMKLGMMPVQSPFFFVHPESKFENSSTGHQRC
ncbi:unnamed protein product, partial [Ectocarpus sp. 8 AP-2014]